MLTVVQIEGPLKGTPHGWSELLRCSTLTPPSFPQKRHGHAKVMSVDRGCPGFGHGIGKRGTLCPAPVFVGRQQFYSGIPSLVWPLQSGLDLTVVEARKLEHDRPPSPNQNKEEKPSINQPTSMFQLVGLYCKAAVSSACGSLQNRPCHKRPRGGVFGVGKFLQRIRHLKTLKPSTPLCGCFPERRVACPHNCK